MKKHRYHLLSVILFAVLAAGFLYLMNYLFEHTEFVKNVFCGTKSAEVLGKVAAGSPNSVAAQEEFTGKLSMYIFSVITVMQFVALFIAIKVVGHIRHSHDSYNLKLKKLESADVFFDVPLYIGLFGTVSAFLVMTFAPQSSRVIAYSSTLIGIIFSLILRLSLLYPLRQKLLTGQEKHEV